MLAVHKITAKLLKIKMTKSNSKKAKKAKNQTQAIGVFKLLIIIGAIPFFIAPFIHIIIPKKSLKVKEYIKYIDDVKRAQATSLTNLKKNSLVKKISLQEYLDKESQLLSEFSEINNINEKEYSTLKNNDKVFGFRSLRVFYIGFGTRIVILFLAVLFFISFHINDNGMKKVLNYIALSFIGVGIYLNIWFLWDGQDYPQSFYFLAIGLMTIIGIITTYMLVIRHKTLSTKFKTIINQLIVFIINSDKYIDSKEKENRHFNDSMEVFEKIVK